MLLFNIINSAVGELNNLGIGKPVHVFQCRNGEQLQSVHEEPSLSAHGSSVCSLAH